MTTLEDELCGIPSPNSVLLKLRPSSVQVFPNPELATLSQKQDHLTLEITLEMRTHAIPRFSFFFCWGRLQETWPM